MDNENLNLQFKNLVKQIKQNMLTHSIMLVSADDYALQKASNELAKMMLCQNLTDKACGFCLPCKKVQHHNHADVMIFPEEKNIIATEEMLKIVDSVSTMPFESDKKIYILNNASQINVMAQNKLLKTLEEPPKFVYFILNVNSEATILPTIKSRCTKIYLAGFSKEEIKTELLNSDLQPNMVDDIIDFANGNMAMAKQFATDKEFLDKVNFVFDIWQNLRHSSALAKFAGQFYKMKKDFGVVMQIFNMVLQRVIEFKSGSVMTTNRKPEIEQIANDFSFEALSKISKNATLLNEKFQRNCNFNMMIDIFLLSFLEVKSKC